jgi:hypothetical protein
LDRGDYYGAFRLINYLADEGQRTVKKEQYTEMWRITRGSIPPGDREELIAQPDDRTVAELFLRYLCPDFHSNPLEFLRRSQQSGSSQ